MEDITVTTEDTSTFSPDAEAVKVFLSEASEEPEQISVTEEPSAVDDDEETDTPEIREVDTTNGLFHTTIVADKTFDKVEAEELTRMYLAPIKDTEVPITDEDQALYLKAMLNDTPLTLTQSLANGAVEITCRALSVYEQDAVLEAAIQAVGGAEAGVMSLVPSMAQQLRATLQVVKINNVVYSPVYLEPKRGKEHADQIADLIKQSDKTVGNMSSAKFGFIARAINVFEHKVAKMHELAYNKTFWKPVETD